MSAQETELTVSIPFEGTHVDVDIVARWFEDDGRYFFDGVIYVKPSDRRIHRDIGPLKLEEIALQALIEKLKEDGRQNEYAEAIRK